MREVGATTSEHEGDLVKLWLLRPVDCGQAFPRTSPWDPWYDKSFGFVVRAETEAEARVFASKEAGAEKGSSWLNSDLSTCGLLKADGEAGIVIKDFASA